MRLINFFLLCCLVAIQYPLWEGKGSFKKIQELASLVDAEKQANAKLKARNLKLQSEVRDLESGTEATIEIARRDLGLVKNDELYIRLVDTARPVVQSIPKEAVTSQEQPSRASVSRTSQGSQSPAGLKKTTGATSPAELTSAPVPGSSNTDL